MARPTEQGKLGFAATSDELPEVITINARCDVRTHDGHRVVLVAGMPLVHFTVGDRIAEAYAIVTLVEQGWADQREVAVAFRCSSRTVRRLQRKFEQGGMASLAQIAGYPKGRGRVPPSRTRLVHELKAKGMSNRAIARTLVVTEKAVRNLLGRTGWKQPAAEQIELQIDVSGADPNLSAFSEAMPAVPADTPRNAADPPAAALAKPTDLPTPSADPNLSAFSHDELLPVSFDTDPADRRVDRIFAYLGLISDAAPMFRSGSRIPRAGVLLALPSLVHSGVFDCAHDTYGSIGPAFYGLRTSIVAMLLMALLRIKRPEALKEHAPDDLGRLLGLDRAPEVKTLRRKLKRLVLLGRATEFGRALAERRVAARGAALGFLYVDGHVRVYHGKRTIPKTHVARMRICMPATSDYWVNDTAGDPLFVLTTEANDGMVKMLPPILAEVRKLIGDRRITIVFDRGGWSPQLFQVILAANFDILTYRKGRWRRVTKRLFKWRKATIDGRKVRYKLADQRIRLLRGKLTLRQVTRLSDNDHQTPIVTSRHDLKDFEVAFRMFERWRQENFFKYLREEYALDALADHQVEAADATREVPNPRWNAFDAELRRARAEVAKISAQLGLEAFTNVESVRRTMRGFKIANAPKSRVLKAALRRFIAAESKRASVPRRVPVKQAIDGKVVKLATESKHLTNLIKMVAYQAEGDLVRMVAPHYKRVDDEGRTLVQSALAGAADIEVSETELLVTLVPLSSAHRTLAIAALCEEIDRTPVCFPGTRLRMRFAVARPPGDGDT